MKIILGIDPGLVNTGWSVVQKHTDGRNVFVACGTVVTKANQPIATRLLAISNEITSAIKAHNINEASIEETFVNKNPQLSLKLGQARGAIILAVAQCGIPLFEYSPTNIKKTITGVGRAEKHQISMMVKVLLPKATPQNEHEADAIAIALCHSNTNINLKQAV